jgi:hypothetical protein
MSTTDPRITVTVTEHKKGSLRCHFAVEGYPDSTFSYEPTVKPYGLGDEIVWPANMQELNVTATDRKTGEVRAQQRFTIAAIQGAIGSLPAGVAAVAGGGSPPGAGSAGAGFAGAISGAGRGALPITMTRPARPRTRDQILWVLIRNSAKALSFPNYEKFLEFVFCYDPSNPPPEDEIPGFCNDRSLKEARDKFASRPLRLPYPGVEPYRLLKAATEVFVTSRCCVVDFDCLEIDENEERRRFVRPPYDEGAYQDYLDSEDDKVVNPHDALPYLALVLRKLPEVRVIDNGGCGDPEDIARCEGILLRKLQFPCLIELIWSYWHEEGMQAQAMAAISRRFQNLRAPGAVDPLAQLEIDPLRPLNNLLWGYLQDEQHRLGVLRRAHEYDHHYGFPLYGRAVAELRTVDRRAKFVEAFHNLLYRSAQFFREDDDTTVIADGFPVLNAIKETHYLLAQGAHNQFGDLPATARQEMLIEQWLLSRPEMRDFLGGRVMVPYPEIWMDRVDAVKTMKSWTDVSVVHFHDLAVFGEQILLSIRYGGWSLVNEPEQAANWARYWRPEIQGYIHGYRAATGVDVSADLADQQELALRYLAPSVHLRNRLALQSGGAVAAIPSTTTAARMQGTRVAMRIERGGN